MALFVIKKIPFVIGLVLTSYMGKKTVSVLEDKFLLPYRADSGFRLAI